LRFLLSVQAAGAGVGSLLLLIALLSDEPELILPAAGWCAGFAALVGGAGVALVVVSRTSGRRGPWPLALLALGALNGLCAFLTFLNGLFYSFDYQFHLAYLFFVWFYFSLGESLFALGWGVVAIFQSANKPPQS
jgi:hypothetical protein